MSRIVPLRWWDLDQVVPAEQQIFAGHQPWSAEQFWAELAGVPATRHYLLACDGDASATVLGYAGLALGPDCADVMTLAVQPSARRRGVATRLLGALLAEAVGRGLPEVLLEVRADNEAALELYRRSGFVPIARRRGYYRGRVDGLVLRARLTGTSSP